MAVDFAKWLATAEPGDRIVYFSGHLAQERSCAREAYVAPLRAAKDAWSAALKGKVTLVQCRRKDGREGYDYIAVAGRFSPVEPHRRDNWSRRAALPYQNRSSAGEVVQVPHRGIVR